ncbi:MAG: ComEC/Rec2 family competence protein [Cyclobacteriaceae bacterium]|nr:ComEC/Rec2 family competence protein [Cyclobacteriaceae bacterium]
MFFWSRFPFVRIVVLFMAGIVLSVFVPGYQAMTTVTVIALGGILVLFHFAKRKLFFHYNWLYGLLIVALSFSLGYLRLYVARQNTFSNHLINQKDVTAYKAVVVSKPVQKGKFFRSTVKLESGKTEKWQPITGNINLYVKSAETPFNYGDELLITGTPQLVAGPMNPEEFNYKRYLSFLNVFHQQFADSSHVYVLSHNNGNPVIAASLKLRAYFSSVLLQNVHGTKELAIANALLLGNKDELDDDIKDTYAASGAMHVLAVSGLHVGIIYYIILTILKHTLRKRRKEWMVAVVAIPLLWGYAFVTGLSPSVLRAVTLFSILALGRATGRSGGMVNMLAVTAFIMLVFDPFLLMQVGFQLSFVAVLGIIYIYPLIRKQVMPSKRVWIFIWDVTAISLAAQLATFPLSVLYFHRFAPYFLVSNLLVIPAATVMVWLGVFLFFFSAVGATFLSGWLGFALEWLIRSVNYVLKVIYHLPGSNWDSLYLNIPQTWLLYFVILGFIVFIMDRKKAWAQATSVCMILLTVSIGVRWVQNNQTQEIAIYNVPSHYAIDLIQSGQLFSIQDSSLMKMEDNIHFHIKPNRLLKGAVFNEPAKLAWKQMSYGKVVVWNGVSILIKEQKVENKKLPFDVIVSESATRMIQLQDKGHDLTKKGALRIDLNELN